MSLAERYKESIALTAQSRKVTPYGAQTASKQPSRFSEGAYPAYLQQGDGARVQDVDGNWYVDYIVGLGAVPLGYNHAAVNEAIQLQLERGLISASLPTPLEEELASRLVKIIPCAADQGQVRFVKTGSEACAAAVRIARRATGRDLVIVVGYHGWHDWVMVTANPHPGIPDAYSGSFPMKAYPEAMDYSPLVMRVPYNDVECIAALMRVYKVAAVMLEPTLLEPPKENYLSDVVTLCTLHGAVSIFDEMVTGFRWARSGGQEYFGVVPDLGVYGKGLANGCPLACVVGPERFLRYADVISGTFGGECLSLAAAGAVLDAYDPKGQSYYVDGPGILDPNPIYLQWTYGNQLLDFCKELHIPNTGYAVHPKITYTGAEMALFLQETARRGLLMHPAGLNISAALTSEDMDLTYRALKGAKEAMEAKVPLEGIIPPTSLFRRNT